MLRNEEIRRRKKNKEKRHVCIQQLKLGGGEEPITHEGKKRKRRVGVTKIEESLELWYDYENRTDACVRALEER